ncbi:MAG: hypothetical protein NTY31_00340 [Candidatus Falkowbacteria bacterium]|nr:hypothetical protein [Candidatus Falkowbacteria bacterium]
MQTNRKTIGFLLIFLGLAIIAAIVYFLLTKKTPTETPLVSEIAPIAQLPAGEEKGTTTPSDQPSNNIQYDLTKETTHTINAADLAQRARAYAERLGSFSTQSDYGNFTDLQMYMTPGMRAWADTYVAEQKASAKSGSYYGIEAKALTTEIKSFDDSAGTAQIIVTAERRTSTTEIGGGEPYLQKLDIGFLKINGEWLMDKAYWEK